MHSEFAGAGRAGTVGVINCDFDVGRRSSLILENHSEAAVLQGDDVGRLLITCRVDVDLDFAADLCARFLD